MHSDPHVPVSFYRNTLFAKSIAGQAELVRKQMHLSGRQRSLLIVIDGKRDFSALARIVPEHTLLAGLGELLQLGLIAAPVCPDEGAAAAGPDRLDDPFMQVKKLMMHSADGYLGAMAGPLVRRIAAAQGEKQVRSVMGQWHMAMRESKFARGEVSELIVRVKASLGESAARSAG